MDFSRYSFLIITHFFIGGVGEQLEMVLGSRAKFLTVIANPFFNAKDFRTSLKDYENGKLVKEKKIKSFRKPELLAYCRDFLLSLFYLMFKGKKYDICIAFSGIDCLVGLLMRKLGIVRVCVFYTIDYVPNKFEYEILNRMYRWIDRTAVENSDMAWDINPFIAQRRKVYGTKKQQIWVRHGVNFSGIKRLPFEQIDRFAMIFSGSLIEESGVLLAIEAFEIIAKEFPSASLIITGAGPLEQAIRNKINQSAAKERIDLKGFLKNKDDLINIMSRCGLGLAPYKVNTSIPAEKLKFLVQQAESYKPREYMACGLPVVITKADIISGEIAEAQAGIAVGDTPQQVADAIRTILLDEKIQRIYRENAIKLASQFDQNTIYNKAFEELISAFPVDK